MLKMKRVLAVAVLPVSAMFALLGGAPTTAAADTGSVDAGVQLAPPSFAVAAASPDWVPTPNGLAYRSCVHEVPNGAEVSADGVVTLDGVVVSTTEPCPYSGMVETPDQVAAASQTAAVSDVVPGVPADGMDSGWWLNSDWLAPKQVVSLTAKWTVPAAPKYNGATIFLFPAVQPGTGDLAAIVQPVLQWGVSGAGGGNYWAIADWFVAPKEHPGDSWYSSLIYTYTGRVLTGTMKRSSGTASKWTVTLAQEPGVDVEVTGETNMKSWRSVNGGALEVYDALNCTRLPNVSSVKFSSIVVKDTSGKVTPSFKNVRWQTYCGAKVSSTSTSTTLGWSTSS